MTERRRDERVKWSPEELDKFNKMLADGFTLEEVIRVSGVFRQAFMNRLANNKFEYRSKTTRELVPIGTEED